MLTYEQLNLEWKQFKHRFIYVGRLAKEKNVKWLIKLWLKIIKENPDYLLLIIGSGSEEQKLKKLVQKLKIIRQIRFLGWLSSKKELIGYYCFADGILIPSLSAVSYTHLTLPTTPYV